MRRPCIGTTFDLCCSEVRCLGNSPLQCCKFPGMPLEHDTRGLLHFQSHSIPTLTTAAGTKGQPAAMRLVSMAAHLPCFLADGCDPSGNVCSYTWSPAAHLACWPPPVSSFMPCICTVSTSSSATEVGRMGSGCAGPVGLGMAAACTCASSHCLAFRDDRNDSAKRPTAMLAAPDRYRTKGRCQAGALGTILMASKSPYAAVRQTAWDTHCMSRTPLPPYLLSHESVHDREAAVKHHSGSLSLRALCKGPHLLPGWL